MITKNQFTGVYDSTGKAICNGSTVRVYFDEDSFRDYTVKWMPATDYPAFDFIGWEGESNGISEAKALYRTQVL